MKAQLSQVHWGLVVTTAVVIYVLTLLLGLAVSIPWLMLSQQGHLDAWSDVQTAILLSAILVIVVTGGGAFWIARRVDHAAWLHGFFVGLLVAIISCVLDMLFSRTIQLVGVILYVLIFLAGWLGGVLGARMRRASPAPEP